MGSYLDLINKKASIFFDSIKHNAITPNERNEELEKVFSKINDLVTKEHSKKPFESISKIPLIQNVPVLYNCVRSIIIDHDVYVGLLIISSALIASVQSIKKMPGTALPPTNSHALFDSSDLLIWSKDTQNTNYAKQWLSLLYFFLLYFNVPKMVEVVLSKLSPANYASYYLSYLRVSTISLQFITGGMLYYNILTIIKRNAHFIVKKIPIYRMMASYFNENNANDSIAKRLQRNAGSMKDYKMTVQQWLLIIFSCVLSLALTVSSYKNPQSLKCLNLIILGYNVVLIDHIPLTNLRNALITILVYVAVSALNGIFGKHFGRFSPFFTSANRPPELSFADFLNTALPGSFIALCYRFDIWRWYLHHEEQEFHFLNWNVDLKYFINAMVSYAIGMLITTGCRYKLHIESLPHELFVIGYMLVSTMFLALHDSCFNRFWKFDYYSNGLEKFPDNVNENEEIGEELSYLTYLVLEDLIANQEYLDDPEYTDESIMDNDIDALEDTND
ncbi:hypothetical protein KAFR_0D03210 [Kazachstania africana CBS 2517]|uniref:Uncharacterized protein n=1 Tax=Kazachstania africana (strain ATCC 22294 / BCRC 22015 / CBS 2517 / CECT 1963 / NBRC 1671 / NRRL Y-8276) TaxID=1071382 RepID=H2AUB9_KAZAF|nr:hypothetical protein KAFR_0D03210 [Kazachstania africana CBS 2517]CCF57969.1 hypothetical protein KAFR_0D03210 [Kazachstania africana CBS 2517]